MNHLPGPDLESPGHLALRDRAGEALKEDLPRPLVEGSLERSGGAPLSYSVLSEVVPGGTAAVHGDSWVVDFDASRDSHLGGPAPADLLAAALAACLSKNIERFSEILDFNYRSAHVAVEITRQASPPKVISAYYRIQVDSSEPMRRLELLHHNLIKYGTITNTLAAVLELRGELHRQSAADRPA